MRILLWLVVGLAGIGLLGLAAKWPVKSPAPDSVNSSAPAPNGPNIVFILVDTLRGDRLHAQRNGQPVMPKLAALAAEGREFPRAISVCSWTRPSVSSLFTGQYVDTHQVYFGISPAEDGGGKVDLLSPKWTTIAETLANAGYATMAWFTNGHLQGPEFGQGFPPENYHFIRDATAEQLTNAVLDGLRQETRPFFAYVHYLDPHAPYDPPAPYKEMFPAPPGITEVDQKALQPEGQIPYILLAVRQMLGRGMGQAVEPMSDAGKEAMLALYDGECRYTDDEVARLIERIRASHPNTLFIFTSDHGEEFWEHASLGHGSTLYQEQLHVPLFMLGPGVEPGPVETRVENISIFKTIATMLGLQPAISPKGQDLLAAHIEEAPVFSRTRGPSEDLQSNISTAISGDQKIINYIKEPQRSAVYNLQQDPAEQQPIVDSAALQAMAEVLVDHRTKNIATRPPRIEKMQARLTPEHMKMMEELGYKRPGAEEK